MESSAAAPEQALGSQTVSLEVLPTEIKVMILCHMPDLSSLSSIVHASPAYHQAYCGARGAILHAITVHTLQSKGIGLLDPWTALHTPQLHIHFPEGIKVVREYVERYSGGLMDDSHRQCLPLEDSLAILKLQQKFAILVANYCKDIFSENPFTQLADHNPLPPSPFELHRLYRALWRYQVYSKFFGLGKKRTPHDVYEHSNGPRESTFGEAEIAHEFLGNFPMHEVEELACLGNYIKDYYSPLTRQKDLLVALGPEKLYEVMTAASESERKVRIAQGEKAGQVHTTMRAALYAYEKGVSRGELQWKESFGKFHNVEDPTTGWLWTRSRGVPNIDIRLRTQIWRLRIWGYVFWDQERLDHWGFTPENLVNEFLARGVFRRGFV